MRFACVFAALLCFVSVPALACGVDSACRIGAREYRISLPEGHAPGTPAGAVIWSHGYGGTAQGVMRNMSLRRMVHAQGMALIAAQGVDGTWDLPNGPRTQGSTGAAEFAYFEAVIADAGARFGIDPTRLVAAGFSAGGMMTWNLACARPALFAGFVPVSGTYWREPPVRCVTPLASIVHIHGDRDITVPLVGREIGQTRQGAVAQSLESYGAQGNFWPAEDTQAGDLSCAQRSNPQGKILDFCLFEGGHSFRTEHLAHGLDRLKQAGQL